MCWLMAPAAWLPLMALAGCGGRGERPPILAPPMDAGPPRTDPMDVPVARADRPELRFPDILADLPVSPRDAGIDVSSPTGPDVVCPAGNTLCGGRCVDLQTSLTNCARCGNVCPVITERCVEGACACAEGLTRCEGVCVDLQARSAHCGACGRACAAGEACSAGECICPSWRSVCGGACVDLGNDPRHCGRCGVVCGDGSGALGCSFGRCDCPVDAPTRCGDLCVDTSRDPQRCGGCLHQCRAGTPCVAGACGGDNGEWLRELVGRSDVEANAVAVSPAGDVVVAGAFDASLGGAFSLQARVTGFRNGFVASLSSQGVVRWSRALGGPGDHAATDVATDGDGNIYLVGDSTGAVDLGEGTASGAGDTFWITSLTPSGTFRWSRRYRSRPGTAFGRAVATDARGNVFLSGLFRDPVDFGGGPLNGGSTSGCALVSLTSTGTYRWAFAMPDGPTDLDIAVGAAGELVLTGDFYQATNVLGVAVERPRGYDVLAVGLTNLGARRWVRSWGGTGEDTARGVTLDPEGNAYIAGRIGSTQVTLGASTLTAPHPQGFVASLDPAGTLRWARTLDTSGDSTASAIRWSPTGTLLVGGLFRGTFPTRTATLTAVAETDAFLVVLDRDGAVLRGRAAAGPRYDHFSDIAPLGNDVIAFGGFDDALTFGATTITTNAWWSAVLARFTP